MLPPPMNASLRMLFMLVSASPFSGCRISPCRCARAWRLRRWPTRNRRSSPSTVYRARGPRAFRSSRSPRSRAKSARSAPTSGCGGGMHMRPRSLSRGNSAICAASSASSRGLDAPLGRLGHQRDLDAHVERRRVKGALLRQAPGHAQAVDAVHPVEALGDRPGLVRLQAADEVPVQRQIPRARPSCPSASCR